MDDVAAVVRACSLDDAGYAPRLGQTWAKRGPKGGHQHHPLWAVRKGPEMRGPSVPFYRTHVDPETLFGAVWSLRTTNYHISPDACEPFLSASRIICEPQRSHTCPAVQGSTRLRLTLQKLRHVPAHISRQRKETCWYLSILGRRISLGDQLPIRSSLLLLLHDTRRPSRCCAGHRMPTSRHPMGVLETGIIDMWRCSSLMAYAARQMRRQQSPSPWRVGVRPVLLVEDHNVLYPTGGFSARKSHFRGDMQPRFVRLQRLRPPNSDAQHAGPCTSVECHAESCRRLRN